MIVYLIFLAITTIIAFIGTSIININSNFENAFSQEGDSEIPPLVEPDKNITIMNIDKHQSKPMSI